MADGNSFSDTWLAHDKIDNKNENIEKQNGNKTTTNAIGNKT